MPRLLHGGRALVCLALAATMLSAAAFWNGYPLLFPDSGFYLAAGNQIVDAVLHGTWDWPTDSLRPIFYGLAVAPLHWRVTLWPVVFAQGLLVAWVIRTSFRCFRIPVRWPGFLGAIGLLVLATPVSWYVSHIMPDIFAGILIVCMMLLLCCRDRLSTGETIALLTLATACVLFHVSHLIVALAILALGALLWTVWRAGHCWLRPTLLAIPVAAGLFGLLAYPWIICHELAFAPNSEPWLLARGLVDGPAMAYLRANCATIHYTLCDDLEGIPRGYLEAFLWSPRSPMQTGKREAIRQEAAPIMLGTMATYPMWMLRLAVRHFEEQLVTIRSEAATNVEGAELRIAMPGAASAFNRTEQAAGRLNGGHLGRINQWDGLVYGFAAIACVVLAVPMWRRSHDRMLGALAVIVVGLAANACVTGVISGVYGRYQGRVAWLPLLWVVMAGFVLWSGRSVSSVSWPAKAGHPRLSLAPHSKKSWVAGLRRP